MSSIVRSTLTVSFSRVSSVVRDICVCYKLMLPFRSQVIQFINQNNLRNMHTFIMINASNEGICVEF